MSAVSAAYRRRAPYVYLALGLYRINFFPIRPEPDLVPHIRPN